MEDGRVLALEAEALHGRLELAGIDLAGGLGVEQVEGLLELLDLVLGEAGTGHLRRFACLRSGSPSHRHPTNLNKIIPMCFLIF